MIKLTHKIMSVVILVFLTLFLISGTARSEPSITISSDPILPVGNLIRNGGFEEPYGSAKVRPAHWGKWGSFGWPQKSWRDVESPCTGEASLRMQNAGGYWQFHVYRIYPKDYVASKSYILSFQGKTNGTVAGNVTIYNLVKGKKTVLASKTFSNTSWEKFSIEFTAPKEKSLLLIFLGLEKNTPEEAVVWYDNMSLFPVNVELSYKVDMPSLKSVKLMDKAGKVIKDSGKLKAGTNTYTAMATVSAEEVYEVKAENIQGKTINSKYPDIKPFKSENIIKNGDFETPVITDSQKLLRPKLWQKFGSLGWPRKASVDRKIFKKNKQSLRIEGHFLGGQALVQKLPAGSYLPRHTYTCAFWGKTSDTGEGKVWVETSDRKNIGWIRFSGEEWQKYRFDFRTPSDNSKELYIFLMAKDTKLEDQVVWWDDVVVRIFSENDQRIYKRLMGVKADVKKTYKEKIRNRSYRIETLIDILGFDIDDLLKYKIVTSGEYKGIKKRFTDISSDWGNFYADMFKSYNKILEKIDEISDSENAEKSEQFLAGRQSAKKIEVCTNAMNGKISIIENKISDIRKSLSAKMDDLKKAKEEAEHKIFLRETASFDSDFRDAVNRIKSENPQVREKAVLELGRLQKNEAVPMLIKLLNDPCYPVRRNALSALAWMRAEKAVPHILSLIDKSRDRWTRRRATQALGMIGAGSAAPKLLELVSDRDGAVAQNAVISLGWLREPSAVPVLKDILEKYVKDAKTGRFENWRDIWSTNNPQHMAAAAIQSLAMTGDKSAVPLLIKLAGNELLPRKENTYIWQAAVYALGLLGDAGAESILLLQKTLEKRRPRSCDRYYAPGRDTDAALFAFRKPSSNKELGITQPEFLKQKRYFYWLDNHFHRAYGRWFLNKNRPDSLVDMCRYAGATDATELIGFRVPSQPEEVEKYFNAAQANGLRCLVGYLPMGKSTVNRIISYYGRYPAFAGIWTEEATFKFLENDIKNVFLRHIQTKYTAEEVAKLGLKPNMVDLINHHNFIDPDFRWKHKVFFAEFAEAMDNNIIDSLREITEYLHMLRKGTSISHYTPIRASVFTNFINLSLWGKMAHVFDLNGTEPGYSTANYENGMFAEMCRDGRQRYLTGMEIYIWRLPRSVTRRWKVGMGISMLHSSQFFVWYWADIFKQMSLNERGRPEAWEINRKMFAKMKKLEPYLVNTDRPGDIALIHSGRTSALLYRDDERDKKKRENARQNLYTQNNIGIYQALNYEHVQCDIIWADTMSAEKLKEYKVLILADAKTLTPGEEEILRNWVKDGGSLIVTGTATLYDQYGIKRSNYGLADVFGVDFLENTCTIPLENIDTGKGMARYREGHFTCSPPKSVSPVLFFSKSRPIEYNLSYGYDRINPKTATVMGTWQNSKEPALTINKYGKGWCLLVTATYPGLMWKPGRKIYLWTLFKHFLPGVKEFLAEATRFALHLSGAKPAFLVENCPWHVEGLIKLQPEKNRMMFQLLNYDERKFPIKNVKAKVAVPSKHKIKVFYPDNGRKISYKLEGDYIVFPVRDFDIHEAVVVEY
ncbi:MAG: HEAT repeat domain-containing protein [Victivallaceae bacterium]|nr:HEAT repeat domain-containing protein [Victivallaceae bacterium]